MNEPQNVGDRVRARRSGYPGTEWIRYSTDPNIGQPWIAETGTHASWTSLEDVRPVQDEEKAEIGNLYFQVGLATGDLMRQNKREMPLDMLYRLMSHEKYEDITGVLLP